MEASALRAGTFSGTRRGAKRRIADDEKLVALVRAGRADAFETVYDRYHRQILSFCRHMLGSREEAEDAVQHTFMAAYTDLRRSDKPIQLRPWLYTIARNHCMSLLRARREQAPLDDAEPSVDGLAATVQRREDLRDLLRDLGRLPDDQRAALVLAELGALSHDEIAEVVGCPKEKVKALVFQARSSLGARRDARETPCSEIREQLATLSGGSLRRTSLRRHLDDCPGCRAFQTEVKRQRAAMAVLLPVAPTAALKSGVMSAIAVQASAAGGLGGAGLAARRRRGSGRGRHGRRRWRLRRPARPRGTRQALDRRRHRRRRRRWHGGGRGEDRRGQDDEFVSEQRSVGPRWLGLAARPRAPPRPASRRPAPEDSRRRASSRAAWPTERTPRASTGARAPRRASSARAPARRERRPERRARLRASPVRRPARPTPTATAREARARRSDATAPADPLAPDTPADTAPPAREAPGA